MLPLCFSFSSGRGIPVWVCLGTSGMHMGCDAPWWIPHSVPGAFPAPSQHPPGRAVLGSLGSFPGGLRDSPGLLLGGCLQLFCHPFSAPLSFLFTLLAISRTKKSPWAALALLPKHSESSFPLCAAPGAWSLLQRRRKGQREVALPHQVTSGGSPITALGLIQRQWVLFLQLWLLSGNRG